MKKLHDLAQPVEEWMKARRRDKPIEVGLARILWKLRLLERRRRRMREILSSRDVAVDGPDDGPTESDHA